MGGVTANNPCRPGTKLETFGFSQVKLDLAGGTSLLLFGVCWCVKHLIGSTNDYLSEACWIFKKKTYLRGKNQRRILTSQLCQLILPIEKP